jgi:RNA polymerase sigma-70 factor (ECF subfamily)
VGRTPKPDSDIGKAYERYSDMLYRIALLELRNHEDAMDAVQDVFLKYMQKNVLLSSEEHEKAWFIRSTINRCRDIYRKNSVRNHEDISEMENLVASEEVSDETKEVLWAVEQLPEKLKSVVVLHYLEGLSVEMTAKSLKISSSAVKMRLSRGREMLKDILEKEEFNV